MTQHRLPSLAKAGLVALGLAAAAAPSVAQQKAHEHGVARLSVAVDGGTLSIELDAALDGFLGFERAPRTDAERKAAADVLAKLQDTAALFKPDAAAACKPGPATVSAPVLEPGAKGKGEHADLEASWRFSCDQPQALKTLDVALFDSFKRLSRIDVQVAAKEQLKVTLRRPARSIRLSK